MSSAAPAAPTPIPALAPTVKPLSSDEDEVAAGRDDVAVASGGVVIEDPGVTDPVDVRELSAVVAAGLNPATVALGSKPLVHLMEPPAELGKLAKAGSTEASWTTVTEQYGSQLACGSFSSVVWLASTLQPPQTVPSSPVPAWHCWIATHSCLWNRGGFQGHERALKPASVQPAR